MKARLLLLIMSILVSFIVIEGWLHVFDPWGIGYLYDVHLIAGSTKVIAGHIVLPEGKLEGKRFDVVILENNTRYVPDTTANDCQIVFIGDSVTFGFGVNDDETFVNLIAQEFPQVEFINAGVHGYNSQQVRMSMKRFGEASGFVWLIVSNDSHAPVIASVPAPRKNRFYWLEYFDRAFPNHKPRPPYQEYKTRFDNDASVIIEAGTLLLAYNINSDLVDKLDVEPISIDAKRFRLARAEGHPNADGHELIKQQMLLPVSDYIEETCQP